MSKRTSDDRVSAPAKRLRPENEESVSLLNFDTLLHIFRYVCSFESSDVVKSFASVCNGWYYVAVKSQLTIPYGSLLQNYRNEVKGLSITSQINDSQLSSMTSLRFLKFDSILTNHLINTLAVLPNLNRLMLNNDQNSKFTLTAQKNLSKLTNLTQLALYYKSGLSTMPNVTSLTVLIALNIRLLDAMRIFEGTPLNSIVPNLKHLHLETTCDVYTSNDFFSQAPISLLSITSSKKIDTERREVFRFPKLPPNLVQCDILSGFACCILENTLNFEGKSPQEIKQLGNLKNESDNHHYPIFVYCSRLFAINPRVSIDQYYDALVKFVSYGVDLNVQNASLFTPLTWMCTNCPATHLRKVIELFVDNGADLNKQIFCLNTNKLMMYTTCLDTLLRRYGTQINQDDNTLDQLLECISLVLRKGANYMYDFKSYSGYNDTNTVVVARVMKLLKVIVPTSYFDQLWKDAHSESFYIDFFTNLPRIQSVFNEMEVLSETGKQYLSKLYQYVDQDDITLIGPLHKSAQINVEHISSYLDKLLTVTAKFEFHGKKCIFLANNLNRVKPQFFYELLISYNFFPKLAAQQDGLKKLIKFRSDYLVHIYMYKYIVNAPIHLSDLYIIVPKLIEYICKFGIITQIQRIKTILQDDWKRYFHRKSNLAISAPQTCVHQLDSLNESEQSIVDPFQPLCVLTMCLDAENYTLATELLKWDDIHLMCDLDYLYKYAASKSYFHYIKVFIDLLLQRPHRVTFY